MIYGYARVSTDGQTVGAQVATLTAAGAAKVFRNWNWEIRRNFPSRRRCSDPRAPTNCSEWLPASDDQNCDRRVSCPFMPQHQPLYNAIVGLFTDW